MDNNKISKMTVSDSIQYIASYNQGTQELLDALLADYCEVIANIENTTPDIIKDRIKARIDKK